MKKWSVMIVLWLVPSLSGAGDELAWEKRLPFKTATINYAIKGMENGRETLYIRDYGKERATYRETTSNVMGMKMTSRTVVFKTPDFIYSYDLEKQQGHKGVNPQKYMIEEYERLSTGEKEKVRENAKEMGAASTGGMLGEVHPNAVKIFGFDCDKLELMGGSSTYLIHDTDVTLKTEMKMMGMKLTTVADSLAKDQVDEKAFEHPAGITAEANSDSDQMALGMAKQAIALLKDPEKARNMAKMPQLTVPGGKGEMTAEDKEMIQQVQQMIKGMKSRQGQ